MSGDRNPGSLAPGCAGPSLPPLTLYRFSPSPRFVVESLSLIDVGSILKFIKHFKTIFIGSSPFIALILELRRLRIEAAGALCTESQIG